MRFAVGLLLIVSLLVSPSPALAEKLDVIVTLQVDEAGNVKDVFAETPAITSFIQAINWDAIAKTMLAESFDDIELRIKGQKFQVSPGLFNTQSARQNMRRAGLDNGYNYSLNLNTKDDENLDMRLQVAGIIEESLQTINLRREGRGNPVNAVDIDILRASMRPDLALSLGAAEFNTEDGALTVELAVENIGQRASAATTAMVFDPKSRTRLASVDIEPLGQGRGVKTKALAKIPREWLGQSRRFDVQVDPTDTILELEEDNNTGTSPAVQLGEALRPDLVVTGVEAKFDEVRDSIVMAILVANTGGARSPGSRIAVRERASGDPVRSAVVPVLNAGENFETVLDVAVPDDWRARSLAFLVDVDPGQLISEAREDNNQSSTEPVDIPSPPQERRPEPLSETPSDPIGPPVKANGRGATSTGAPGNPQDPTGYGLTVVLLVAAVAAAAAAFGTALVLGRLLRRPALDQDGIQSHAHVPTLRARAGGDRGHQLVEAVGSDISRPALGIRPRIDPGFQQVDGLA
ncbi:MAG: CARDB domain-containing protein [Alphaproteobacteria bacterium]